MEEDHVEGLKNKTQHSNEEVYVLVLACFEVTKY